MHVSLLDLPVVLRGEGEEETDDGQAGNGSKCLVVVEPARHTEAFDDAADFHNRVALNLQNAVEGNGLAPRRHVAGIDRLAESAVLSVLFRLDVQGLAPGVGVGSSQGFGNSARAVRALPRSVSDVAPNILDDFEIVGPVVGLDQMRRLGHVLWRSRRGVGSSFERCS